MEQMGDDGVAAKNMIASINMAVTQNLIFDNDHLMNSSVENWSRNS